VSSIVVGPPDGIHLRATAAALEHLRDGS
jgi:hypothetical protein